eukprot:Skav212126  [mRNA]  locus=scaffold386:572307:573221:+ [translate_table: standard]
MKDKHQVNFCQANHWVFRSGLQEDSGCTGRIGIPENTFIALCGYDEEFEPTGYQDMDLYKRAESVGKSYFLRNCQAGCSIPNDLDPDSSRGPMKINYAISSHVRWSKQNDSNAAVGKKKLSQGFYWRNISKPPHTEETMYEMLTAIGGPPIMPFRLAAKPPSARTEMPPPPGEGGTLPGPREGRILPGSARQETEEPEVTHPKDPPALPAEAASPKQKLKTTKPPPAHLSTSSSTGQPLPKARPIFAGPQAPPPPAGEGGNLPSAKSCEGRTLQYKEPPGPPPPQSAFKDCGCQAHRASRHRPC